MTLLDRHLFRNVLSTCLVAVALFAFVFMLGNLIRDLLGYLLAGQIGLFTFSHLVLLLVPAAAVYALPLGMLTGVLLTLGRLSADSEITAMRTSGLSIPRIALPIFVLAALGTLTALKVNFDSMPWARVVYHKELADAIRANPVKIIVPGTFIHDFPNTVLYVGQKKGPDLKDIWIWKLDDQHRVVESLRAETGHVVYDDAADDLIPTLGRSRIEYRNSRHPEDFSEAPNFSSFEWSDPLKLSLESFFGKPTVRRKLQWMTYPELGAEQDRLEGEARRAWADEARARGAAVPAARDRARELDRSAMKVAMTTSEKANLALAVFSFALVGVPLGIKVSRRETSANLGIAVLMALSYYFLTTMIGWLDRHPEYRPDLLLWGPNLIFLGIGGWLTATMDRR